MKLLRFRSRPPQPSISSNAMLMTFIRCHWSACFSLGFERCPPHPPLSCVYLCGASLTVSQHRMDASFWEHCGGGNVVIHCKTEDQLGSAKISATVFTRPDLQSFNLIVSAVRAGTTMKVGTVVFSALRPKPSAFSHTSFENVQMIWNPFNYKSGYAPPPVLFFFCPTPSVTQRDAVTLNHPPPLNKPQWQLSASCHCFRPNC